MERITYKSMFGDYGLAADIPDKDDEIQVLRNALGAYEDLGFTPEELKEILSIKQNNA